MGKPHGLGGEVYVIRISDDRRRFEPGSQLVHEDGRALVVQSTRDHRNRFLVKFEGTDDRTAAETLRGALYVDASSARSLEPGEFWEHDLAGLDVVLAGTGQAAGTVARVEEGPAQDLLVVDTPRGERLVPLVAEIVVDVDLAARKVTIDPPEGLL
ncbi:MAG TPA: ribosome maturation factor RimM [Actinomycetota bacterium]|nr:ribosome maturation factor RimM [Actinomycetota bacterium]